VLAELQGNRHVLDIGRTEEPFRNLEEVLAGPGGAVLEAYAGQIARHDAAVTGGSAAEAAGTGGVAGVSRSGLRRIARR